MSMDLSSLPNTTLAAMLRLAGRATPIFADVIDEAADRLTAASQRARVSRAHAVRTNAANDGVTAHAVRTEGGVGGGGSLDAKASFEAENKGNTKAEPLSVSLSLRADENDDAHAVRTHTRGWTPGYTRFHAAYPPSARRVCNRYWIANGLETGAERIIAGLEVWKLSKRWREEGGRFILNMRDWLENRKWEDAPPEASSPRRAPDFGSMQEGEVEA